MVQKWNFHLCLPCWNVFLTWLPLLYFYIILKNYISSLTVISYVMVFIYQSSQVPTKYQGGAKNGHEFLHSKYVIGWFWSKAGRFKTRPPSVGDLDVHLLLTVCSWACFHFLSGQLQFSSQAHHPIKCFLTFFCVANVWLC